MQYPCLRISELGIVMKAAISKIQEMTETHAIVAMFTWQESVVLRDSTVNPCLELSQMDPINTWNCAMNVEI